MCAFTDTWYGDVYQHPTLSTAKREAKKLTFGHSIAIYRKGEIVAIVKPNERPLP